MPKLVFLCLFIGGAFLHAMDGHRLETSIGLSYGLNRDTVVSSVPRNQLFGDLVLGYHAMLERHSHHVRFIGRAGGLATSYDPLFELGEIGAALLLRYQGHARVYTSDVVKVSVGGMIYGGLDISIPSFLGYAWNGEFGIGPSVEIYAHLGKHSFDVLVSTPVLGMMNRPLYAVYNFSLEESLERNGFLVPLISDPFFVSYHNLVRIDAELAHRYSITKRIDLLTRYEIGYRFVRIPAEAHQLRQGISFGVDIRLRGDS